jgi:hypothetical protein
MNKTDIIILQKQINSYGYGPVAVDGIYGKKTATAYENMVRDSDVGGEGISMPVPAPVTPWWMHPALISGIATMLATILQMSSIHIDSATVEPLLMSVFGVITGGMAIYAAFKKSSTVDKTLVVPGFRVTDIKLRRRQVQANSDRSANTTRPMDDRGPFFSDGG